MKITKEKIEKAVQQYAKMFPTEYKAFLISTRQKNEKKLNDWGETKKTDMLSRHLIDIPETLYYAFRQHLTDEEIDWLYAKGTHYGKWEGMNWFMKKFPQFKITKDF